VTYDEAAKMSVRELASAVGGDMRTPGLVPALVELAMRARMYDEIKSDVAIATCVAAMTARRQTE
jgi:hypothetical protein